MTWGGLPQHARRVAAIATAALLAAGVAGPAMATAAQAAPPSTAGQVSVIVRELAGTGNGPERAVEAFGGTVDRELEIIHGFIASVPGDRLDALRAVAGVSDVTENAGLTLASTDVEAQVAQAGSLFTIANQVTAAPAMPTIAEGIETTQQQEHVAALGCDLAQGLLRSRPVDADMVMSLVCGESWSQIPGRTAPEDLSATA